MKGTDYSDPRHDRSAGLASITGREHLLAAFILLVLTVALTHNCYFPLRSLPNPHLDHGQMAWNLWHTAESVLAGRDPYVTDEVVYPIGAKLVTHTLVPG